MCRKKNDGGTIGASQRGNAQQNRADYVCRQVFQWKKSCSKQEPAGGGARGSDACVRACVRVHYCLSRLGPRRSLAMQKQCLDAEQPGQLLRGSGAPLSRPGAV